VNPNSEATALAATRALRSIALPDIATVEDLSTFFGISPPTVRRHLREGLLPGRRVGRRWFVSRPALLAHLAGHEVEESRARLRAVPNTRRAERP
jgi:excisionase family DNA binding protein